MSISATGLLQGGSMALGFVISILLTRTLGARGYGAYSYGMAWVAALLIPAVMGMDRFLIRGVAVYQASRQWGLLRGLLRWANQSVMILSIAIALVAAAVGYVTLRPPLRDTFCLAMPLVPVTALVIVRRSTMTGLSRVVSGQIPEFLIRPALLILALLPFALGIGHGLTSSKAMMLNVCAVVFAFLIGVELLRRNLPTETRDTDPDRDARSWRRAAIPMMLLGGMWLLNPYVATIMLGSIRGARAVGVYAVVVNLSLIMTIGLLAVTTPLSPRVAQLYAAGDAAGLQRVVSRGAHLAVAWSLPVAIALIALQEPLLSIFGKQFTGAGLPLTIMVIGQIANTVAGPAGIVLTMTRHERAAAVGVGAGLVANIALNAALIPSLGVEGAALGTSVSRIIWNGALAAYAAIQLRINTTAAARTPGPSRTMAVNSKGA